MKTMRRFTAISFALTLGLAGLEVSAQEEYIPKVQQKVLYQGPIEGVDGKEMTVAHFGIPPGYVGEKHIHPGSVFVYVLEGELTVELAGETKTFRQGELYPEDINAAMVGKNASASDDLEILVFQVGDIGKPMMIKVE